RGSRVFAVDAEVLRGVINRFRNLCHDARRAGREHDAFHLRAVATHVAVVEVDVPRVGRRPTEAGRRGVATDANFGGVEVVGQRCLDGESGSGRIDTAKSGCGPEAAAGAAAGLYACAAVGASGRTEQGIRKARRQSEPVGADAVVERLRVRAVDVRRLIPNAIDVEFASPRSVDLETLIPPADIVRPEIELIFAVLAAGG